MQAIILAAGMGKRLRDLTAENTKCMVSVNGITIIERMLRILDKKGLSRIVVVVGYQGKKLQDFIEELNISTPVFYVYNEYYDKTNNIYSLLLAKDQMQREDTLLFESDLVFDEQVVDHLLMDKRPDLVLVDKFESWMDGTCMVLDSDDNIVDFISGKYLDFSQKDHYYKTVNIYKFSKEFSNNIYIPFLEAYLKAVGNNEYYESVIKLLIALDTKGIKAKRLEDGKWYEIDDIQDLDIAQTMFTESAQVRYDMVAKRYGGYWRFPKLLDYCYLVNPYFPPARMLEEMQSNYAALLTQYPSGIWVNSLLAAKTFGVSQKQIVIGNGASELIKELMEHSSFERIGLIKPTFEEYFNRFRGEKVIFDAQEKDFQYSAEDIMDYFGDRQIDCLILINPDNPSGNYIEKPQLLKLLYWAGRKGISLVIDESFSDFVYSGTMTGEWEKLSLISSDILQQYDKLYVVKSISKSHGVPGLRLGVLASGDISLLDRIKADMAIWNINSFGEFYMQIMEKYKKQYKQALINLTKERTRFVHQLSAIDGLEVYPSQANYVMCEVTKPGWTARGLSVQLLEKHIFIKDLTSKMKQQKRTFVRMAVRGEADNDYLIKELTQLLN